MVEKICYSFTDCQNSFERFLDVIKVNCSEMFELLRASDFQALLLALVAATKKRDDGFFRSLNQASQVLERAFELLREMKIVRFTQENISNLVSGNLEFFAIMRQRPSILKSALTD